MKKRLMLSQEQREDWVNKWRSSGLSGARFAARHGLNESTLYRWGQRLNGESAVARASVVRSEPGRKSPSRVPFTEVRVGSAGEPEGSIEVTLGGGRAVRVSGWVERAQLEMVLEALGAC